MAFFLRRVANRSEAEDLTQEVLIRVLSADGPHPDAYIFQIAQNLLIDRSRKAMVRERYRRTVGFDPDREIDALDPHRHAEGREQVKALADALAAVPERTRSMFILYRFERMTQESIARRYGISTSAVKQHVARALAIITGHMRDYR